jgi:hypothetical protein
MSEQLTPEAIKMFRVTLFRQSPAPEILHTNNAGCLLNKRVTDDREVNSAKKQVLNG